MKSHSKVINVSSKLGNSSFFKDPIHSRIRDPLISTKNIDELINQYKVIKF